MNDPADGRPYADLTPHAVLDALALASLHGDGRLLQLNSYENRVFQVILEDGSAVVAKFYRPGRWSDAQILEEHGFALELAAAEVPVVAPLVIDRTRADAALECLGEPPTLGRIGALRFAVTPRRAGRAPELDDPDTLEWIGRFIGRLHTVGAARPFAGRRTGHHVDRHAGRGERLQTLHEQCCRHGCATWRGVDPRYRTRQPGDGSEEDRDVKERERREEGPRTAREHADVGRAGRRPASRPTSSGGSAA